MREHGRPVSYPACSTSCRCPPPSPHSLLRALPEGNYGATPFAPALSPSPTTTTTTLRCVSQLLYCVACQPPRVCQCTNPRCSSCVSPASHSLSSWWCMTPPVPPVPAVPAETHNRRDRGVSVSGRRIAYPSSDSTVPFPRHAASPDTKLF